MKLSKIFAILILFTIVLTTVGCKPEIQPTENTTSEALIETTIATHPEVTEPPVVPKTYTDFGSYSEGLAWVKYSDNQDYCGCINEKGEMLFCYNDDEIDILTDFENGYSYLLSSGKAKLYVIDKSGKICSSYNRDNVNAYGFGYTIVESHHSDFDSEYYEYTIYDADGNDINSYRSNDTPADFNYWGEGLFLLNAKNNYLFLAPSNQIVAYNYETSSYDDTVDLNNGLAFVNNDCLELDETFVVVDNQGNITDIEERDFFNSERETYRVYGNSVVYYDDDEPCLVSYNLLTNNVYYLDDDLVEKLETTYAGSVYEISLSQPSFNNEGFLVSMIGQDKNRYVAILDYEMNLQQEPIKYHEEFEAYDNSTCRIDDVVYDMKGNVKYFLYPNGIETIISDSENILLVSKDTSNIDLEKDLYEGRYGKCNFAAIDKDGIVIFDTIDTTNTVIKNTYNN